MTIKPILRFRADTVPYNDGSTVLYIEPLKDGDYVRNHTIVPVDSVEEAVVLARALNESIGLQLKENKNVSMAFYRWR